jgi:hypothetical protein
MATTSVATDHLQGDDELLVLLKSELGGVEQQLFVDGFRAYMQYDARKDFVVILDNVYEWLGFTRKDSAKKVVHKHLTDGVHFTTEVSASRQLAECTEDTLDRTQTVVMTVHGFKQLCMVANTDKSRRIRDYYIAMEAGSCRERSHDATGSRRQRSHDAANLCASKRAVHAVRVLCDAKSTGACRNTAHAMTL